MVHIGLEGGWRVAKSKEHDGWFIESERGGEGHLPMVLWSDEDVVISPLDVGFGKDFAILKLVYQLRYEG